MLFDDSQTEWNWG